MEGFEVEPATLRDQARAVEGVIGAVQTGRLGNLRAGATGSGELDAVTGSFLQLWQEGLEVMLEDAADLTDGMRAAAARYEDTDEQAAAQIRSAGRS